MAQTNTQAAAQTAQQLAFNNHIANNQAQANNQPDDDDDDDEEAPSTLSRIDIYLNTPLHIIGDGNLIAIEPSVTANKVALGVVNALKHLSMIADGVPMIDEEGRPRPIKVCVTAGMKVEGSRNLVGERAVMERVAPGFSLKPKHDLPFAKAPLSQLDAKKRDREESDASELLVDTKRTRRD